MARLVYSMFASADGYVEAPGHDIGWSAPDEELHAYANNEARASTAFLYGRRLYELMTRYWPTADAEPDTPEVIADFARVWRDRPKFVFSRTLTEVAWNSQLVREDRWPGQADLGAPIMLPGGEVGILTAWWNAEDGSAWRWQVEFSNHR